MKGYFYMPGIMTVLAVAVCKSPEKKINYTGQLESHVTAGDSLSFEGLINLDWKEQLNDPCTGDWEKNWFLDGVKGKIIAGPEGMELYSGPSVGDDSSHVVLWTKQDFSGNLKIEYQFTRLDDSTRYVNIIYILAEGSGHGKFDKDISRWSYLRTVPAMRLYFNNMNTYHISYAAFDNDNLNPYEDYIRARRYTPDAGGRLKGTELQPDYFNSGMFEKNVPHKITIIKYGRDLFMQIEKPGKKMLCHWRNDSLPDVTEGRIGLRQMGSRNSRYGNFLVSTYNP